jgi:hypothetical protein
VFQLSISALGVEIYWISPLCIQLVGTFPLLEIARRIQLDLNTNYSCPLLILRGNHGKMV